MIVFENRRTHQVPIPHKYLFELHALFSKSLAWVETQSYMMEQRDQPSKSESCYSGVITDISRRTKCPTIVVARAVISHYQVNMD